MRDSYKNNPLKCVKIAVNDITPRHTVNGGFPFRFKTLLLKLNTGHKNCNILSALFQCVYICVSNILHIQFVQPNLKV